MIKLEARFRRFCHCLFAVLRLKSCCAATISKKEKFHFFAKTTVIGCTCGKVFYAEDGWARTEFEVFLAEINRRGQG